MDRSPSEIARILRDAKDACVRTESDGAVVVGGVTIAHVEVEFESDPLATDAHGEPSVYAVGFVHLTRAGRAALNGTPWQTL